MAKLRLNDLRKMSRKDREKRLGELKRELMNIKGKVLSGGIDESVGQIRKLRRTIAQIYTINREEELKINISQKKK